MKAQIQSALFPLKRGATWLLASCLLVFGASSAEAGGPRRDTRSRRPQPPPNKHPRTYVFVGKTSDASPKTSAKPGATGVGATRGAATSKTSEPSGTPQTGGSGRTLAGAIQAANSLAQKSHGTKPEANSPKNKDATPGDAQAASTEATSQDPWTWARQTLGAQGLSDAIQLGVQGRFENIKKK